MNSKSAFTRIELILCISALTVFGLMLFAEYKKSVDEVGVVAEAARRAGAATVAQEIHKIDLQIENTQALRGFTRDAIEGKILTDNDIKTLQKLHLDTTYFYDISYPLSVSFANVIAATENPEVKLAMLAANANGFFEVTVNGKNIRVNSVNSVEEYRRVCNPLTYRGTIDLWKQFAASPKDWEVVNAKGEVTFTKTIPDVKDGIALETKLSFVIPTALLADFSKVVSKDNPDS